MSKEIRVDFSGVSDGGSFYVAPGDYTAKVTKIEQDMGKDFPYLIWYMEIIGTGVTIKHNTTLKPEGLFNLYNVMGALMGTSIPKSVVRIDPDKFIGRTCTVTVADREYNGKTYSNIAKFSALKTSAVSADADEI